MIKTSKFLFLLASTFTICCSKRSSDSENLKVIAYSNTETYSSHGIIKETLGMNLRIAFLKDIIMYEVPSIKGKITQKSIRDTLINEVKPGDTVFTYFIFKKNHDKGFMFSSIIDNKGVPVSKDSTLISIGLHPSQMQFYEVILPKHVTIIKDKNTSELKKETYFYVKQHINDADSLYRYYDRALLDIPFSLAPNIDKEKQSKMWRMAYTNLPFLNKQTMKQMDRVDGNTEFRKIQIKDKAQILALFKRTESFFNK